MLLSIINMLEPLRSLCRIFMRCRCSKPVQASRNQHSRSRSGSTGNASESLSTSAKEASALASTMTEYVQGVVQHAVAVQHVFVCGEPHEDGLVLDGFLLCI